MRHLHWSARRQATYNAMNRIHASERQIGAFADCGNSSWLHVRPDGSDVRLVCNHCKNRFCEPCQRARAHVISACLTDHIQKRTTRFVTLTQRASHTPLRDQIDKLYRDFSTLRRRRWWKGKVTGGAAFLEVKVGENSGAWHPHLHVLVEGDFLAQNTLADEWYAVTGASFIVHVKAVPDCPAIARYVTKYVTKPADISVFNQPARLDEMIGALKGRRLCFTFGSWRGLCLDPDVTEDGEWLSAGSLETVIDRACTDDLASVGLLIQLAAKCPNLIPTIEAFGFKIRQVDRPAG